MGGIVAGKALWVKAAGVQERYGRFATCPFTGAGLQDFGDVGTGLKPVPTMDPAGLPQARRAVPLLLGQRLFHRRRHLFRQRVVAGVEAGHDLPPPVHQELVEVPGDGPGEPGVGLRAGQEGVERVDVVSGHRDLGQEREGDAVVQGAELGDLGVRARLLAAEVVGRKAEDDQAAVAVLLPQRLQPLVLRSEAAARGGVDQQQDLATVALQPDLAAVDAGEGEIEHALGRGGERQPGQQQQGGKNQLGARHGNLQRGYMRCFPPAVSSRFGRQRVCTMNGGSSD